MCIKKGFRWVLQACLGIFYVEKLATPSRSSNMRIWALCGKISRSLTEKNPSFQNWPKKWSLVHGPRLEGHPSTILMSWIQHIQKFIDPRNSHHSMACWIPPPIGFPGYLLNPYQGHRMESVHQNELSMGHANVFRKVPCGNASHMFTIEQYVNLTPMCKNFTFTYSPKP